MLGSVGQRGCVIALSTRSFYFLLIEGYMKIGFCNVYSFRPHVEHLYYLSYILERAGHDTYFLTCDSSVSNCYPRELKKTSRLKECSKCISGGIRSFPVENVYKIKNAKDSLGEETLDYLTLSSSCTLTRTESEYEWDESEVVEVRSRLHGPTNDVYFSSIKWIEENSLDAVICFNGRMDLTRAITYACEVKGIPYITHERTWLGDGIQLIPNANCLSIKAVNRMTSEYDDKPLNKRQAYVAARFASERFLQRNSLEWRVYNKNPEAACWPKKHNGARVLILPSSKNEFAGHEEWKTEWKDNTEAIDDFVDAFGVEYEQIVLRCHPNWSEKIGKVSGRRSSELYARWAKERGVHCIFSEEKANTYDLIQQADIVVLNGGSSAVEAGICGKQVVCLGPSTYQGAGFVRTFLSKSDLANSEKKHYLDPDMVIRKTLRYIYLRSHRYPQFVDYVRAIETTKYEYYSGADANRLVDILKTGTLAADDSTFGHDLDAENEVIELVKRREWEKLIQLAGDGDTVKKQRLDIGRRKNLRWLDGVRDKFPRGDR